MRLTWLTVTLAALGLICLGTTYAWYEVTDHVIVAGYVYGVSFLVLAAVTPYLARREEDGPLCRACYSPVREEGMGFCLACGVEEPLRGRPA